MAFEELISIERVDKLTKKEFMECYYRPQKPVVITNQIDDWPAYTKWNFQFLREVAGEKKVPLYDGRKTDYTKKVNEPDFTMTMSEYIDILEQGPTDLRIFLYNLMKDVPVMKSDMQWPDLGPRLLKSLPLVFFGGEDAKVFMHYDIDFPNIFHIHFAGASSAFWSIRKRVSTCIVYLIRGYVMKVLILITLIMKNFPLLKR